MRKLGFTLAEVLITLGIIGVIATLTLPTLMSNTTEREYATGIKKAVSALTEAVQMQVALENISFDEMVDSGTDTDLNNLYTMIVNRMQTEKYADEAADYCQDGQTGTAMCLGYGGAITGTNVAMFFKDGSALIWDKDVNVSSTTCSNAEGEIVNCFKVIYDLNGTKKPNMLSNCKGDRTKNQITNDHDATKCGQKLVKDTSGLVARDQYPLALHGQGVYPNSAAGRYLFNKK